MRRSLYLLPWTLILANAAAPAAIQDGLRIAGPAVIRAAAFDGGGNLYLAGTTFGITSITARTVFGPAKQQHLFVAKIASSRQSLTYVAEIGSSQSDEFSALAVDSQGEVYLAGNTTGSDFPISDGAFQTKGAPGGGFVVKLDSTGSHVLYSTFLDESPYTKVKALAIDSSGDAYAAGMTNGLTFPTSAQAYKRTVPADVVASTNSVGFVAELNPSGSALVRSTLLGGTYDQDYINAIAISPDGTIHVAGQSYSRDFPFTAGFSTPGIAQFNAFRARLDSSGSHLLYSSLLGGSEPLAIALDASGREWLVENSNSAIFVDSWNTSDVSFGSRIVAPKATANTIAILPNGHLMIGGSTTAWDFPTQDAMFPCMANLPHSAAGSFDFGDITQPDGFVMELDTTGKVVFSSFIGGRSLGSGNYVRALAVDPKGGVLVGGFGVDPSFPGGATFGSDPANSALAFRFDLSRVSQGGPAPSCLVAGVTFQSAAEVTGSFATIFGSGLGPSNRAQFVLGVDGRVPTELAGTQVTVAGIPAPILYAQDRQINFLVPQSVRGSGDVCVLRGIEKTCLFSYFVSSAPAVFRITDQIFAILNQDGSLNTPQNPAARGSYVSIFGAGFGPYTRSFADGAVTDLPVTVLVQPVRAFFYDAGINCLGIGGSCTLPVPYEGEVVFAGAAPFAVNGLTQINIKTAMTTIPGTGRLDLRLSDQSLAQIQITLK